MESIATTQPSVSGIPDGYQQALLDAFRSSEVIFCHRLVVGAAIELSGVWQILCCIIAL